VELLYKPDLEVVRERWSAFWKGESPRPLASVVVPRVGCDPAPYPEYLAGRDGDFEPVLAQMLAFCETHEFLGEAVPYFILEWGPDTFSAFLGADLVFTPGTSWSVPFVDDWDETEIRFRRDSKWWRLTENLIDAIRTRHDGKFLINPPTLVANLDALAAVRGTQCLLLDLVTCPDQVQRALDAVCRAHTEVLAAYATLLDWDTYGSVNVDGMYVQGRQSRPQCDVSCMISPEMFREFVVPCLERETREVDAAEYHLDGPQAVKHLEALAEIAGLSMISFTPGTDVYAVSDEVRQFRASVYRQVDDLGKGQVHCGTPEEVLAFAGKMRSKQLFLKTEAPSRAAGERFLEQLEALR
jgi:hypothetical protein